MAILHISKDHANWDLGQHPFWSNRRATDLIQTGRIVIGWDEEALGEYGSNKTTDEELDRYVETLISHPKGEAVFRGITGWGNPTFYFVGAIPGRKENGTPVITILFST